MFQEYVQKSTKKVLRTIEIAVSELVAQKQNLLTPDFILLALLSQPDCEAVKIIATISPDPVDVTAQLKARIGQHYALSQSSQTMQIVGSQELEALFRTVYEEAKTLGDEYISTGTLLIAMFGSRVGHIAEFLRQVGLKRGQALEALKKLRQGKLDPVIGREDEIGQVIQTLSRRRKNNPVLIGEAGVGKTVIVERLAQRIVDADVPDTLLNRRVLSLDMAEIIASLNRTRHSNAASTRF